MFSVFYVYNNMKNANIIYENLKNITISLLKEPTSSD